MHFQISNTNTYLKLKHNAILYSNTFQINTYTLWYYYTLETWLILYYSCTLGFFETHSQSKPVLWLQMVISLTGRALCRIKLLPVTHVFILVDTWMLTVKPVYKLLNVSDDLKWITNTHVTPFSLTFKA